MGLAGICCRSEDAVVRELVVSQLRGKDLIDVLRAALDEAGVRLDVDTWEGSTSVDSFGPITLRLTKVPVRELRRMLEDTTGWIVDYDPPTKLLRLTPDRKRWYMLLRVNAIEGPSPDGSQRKWCYQLAKATFVAGPLDSRWDMMPNSLSIGDVKRLFALDSHTPLTIDPSLLSVASRVCIKIPSRTTSDLPFMFLMLRDLLRELELLSLKDSLLGAGWKLCLRGSYASLPPTVTNQVVSIVKCESDVRGWVPIPFPSLGEAEIAERLNDMGAKCCRGDVKVDPALDVILVRLTKAEARRVFCALP
jgi:hypothetical protein